MNRAIFLKTCRDSIALIALCAISIVLFVVLFVWAMLTMGPDLMVFAKKFAFITKIFAVMGLQVEGEFSINILLAVCFTHMIVIILSWSAIIAGSTRSIVGEIEQGTADLLLTLPVTRWQVYVSTSLVWIIACVLIAASPVAGVMIGTMVFETGEEVVLVSRYIAPAVNSFALLMAVGGLSSLVSCLVTRRGHAITVVVGVGLVSMLLNFLEPFIPQIAGFRHLGLLNYFRPVEVVRTGEWPISNISILIGFGIITWVIGLVIYSRRDIPTS